MGSRNGSIYVFGGGPPGLFNQRLQGGGARGGRRELAGPGAGQPERRHAHRRRAPGRMAGSSTSSSNAPSAGRPSTSMSPNGPLHVTAHHRGDDGARAERPNQAARRRAAACPQDPERAPRLRGRQRAPLCWKSRTARWPCAWPAASGPMARSRPRRRNGPVQAAGAARVRLRRARPLVTALALEMPRAATMGDGPGTIPRARWSSAAARWP